MITDPHKPHPLAHIAENARLDTENAIGTIASIADREHDPTKPASDSDMLVYRAIAANYHKESEPAGESGEFQKTHLMLEAETAGFVTLEGYVHYLKTKLAALLAVEAQLPALKPLTDEQIEKATGAKIGTPIFLVAKGFAIAIEAAHSIKEQA